MCQQPPGPRGPTCCQPAPPVCSSCVCGGWALSLMPARRPRRRAGPAAPGLPAGVGQRARRRAKLFPSFTGRAGPRQKGLPVITRCIFANRRCGLAPFPLAAFSSLEIAGQGPGMASLRRDGKWPGVPAAASRRAAARRPRAILSLAATGQHGSWLARAPRERVPAGCATAEAREQSGQAAQREGRALAAAVARLGSFPGGPQLAQVRPGVPGPRWPYPASLIADPRYGPSGINVRLRSRNAVSVTRNEFRPPAPYPQTWGPAPRGRPPSRHRS